MRKNYYGLKVAAGTVDEDIVRLIGIVQIGNGSTYENKIVEDGRVRICSLVTRLVTKNTVRICWSLAEDFWMRR